MNDCIYTAFCTRNQCDFSCPVRGEIEYWMDRCRINMNNPVLNLDANIISKYTSILEDNKGGLVAIPAHDTLRVADILTYIAICLHGRGTAYTHGIYKLDFADFMSLQKSSFNMREEPEKLEYMKIFSRDENFLIIYNLDYIKFGDFESQMLLQLLQQRKDVEKSTYIVIPESYNILGNNSSPFYNLLLEKIREVRIG